MTDLFPGFDDNMPNIEVARLIHQVRDSYTESIDKLLPLINRGGTVPEMRAALDAYQVLDNVHRELGEAAKRALEGTEDD